MRIKNISINKSLLLLAYKLLYDMLLLGLITLTGVLLADGLLPGLLTSKISFSKIIIAIIAILASIAYLGKKLDLVYSQVKTNHGKTLPALVLFSFLLVGNSLLKFTLWENIMITLTTLFVFFLFYELIFHDEAE